MDVSRTTLDRVRRAFRRCTPGNRRRPATPQEAPQALRNRPSPDVWGARLVTARRTRRERYAPPVEASEAQGRAEWFPPRDWEAEEAWERTGALVRPFLLAHETEERGDSPGAQARPCAGPWSDAR